MKTVVEEMREDFKKFMPDHTDKNGCWLWQGPVDSDGFGIYECQGKQFKAHRSSAILAGKRAILSYMKVFQTCGNKLCCSPSHLRILDKSAKHEYDCLGKESIIPKK